MNLMEGCSRSINMIWDSHAAFAQLFKDFVMGYRLTNHLA